MHTQKYINIHVIYIRKLVLARVEFYHQDLIYTYMRKYTKESHLEFIHLRIDLQ